MTDRHARLLAWAAVAAAGAFTGALIAVLIDRMVNG